MTFFQQLHAHTANLHYDGPDNSGKKIIIDAAEIAPGEFEVMAMYRSGGTIECKTVCGLANAQTVYDRMVKRHTQPPEEEIYRPLTGKYAKLRNDLCEALCIGRDAEAADPEDGGSCNFDSAAIRLPYWSEKLVERAAQEAGTSCFTWKAWGAKFYVFHPDSRSQANARSRNAEAMARALRAMGYDAVDYCQLD